MNSQMFNSFLDGTKSAIEMAAVANASGLRPPENGLEFRLLGWISLQKSWQPTGLVMSRSFSSLNRDGSDVDRDLRWGVFVVLEAYGLCSRVLQAVRPPHRLHRSLRRDGKPIT